MQVGHQLDIENYEIEQCLTNRPRDIWSASHKMLNLWHGRESDTTKKWNQLYAALHEVLAPNEMKSLDRKIRESDGTSHSYANSRT